MPIHPTAIVHRRAEIASDVEIGPWSVIDEHVQIQAGCRLYQNVFITGWTVIHENCILHPHVIVGHDPQDVKYKGERSYCRIGAHTILRENVTIHRGTDAESTTSVGEHCFLLAGSHVGHNASVGDWVTMINNAALGGHVSVGDRTTLGGMAAVHQFVRIGELCMVAASAKLVQDVPPFALTDKDGRVAGLNRIGLRRAGLSREEIQQIREAYRVLYGNRTGFSEAVRAVIAKAPAGPVKRLASFLTAPSRRGVSGRSRRDGGTELRNPGE